MAEEAKEGTLGAYEQARQDAKAARTNANSELEGWGRSVAIWARVLADEDISDPKQLAMAKEQLAMAEKQLAMAEKAKAEAQLQAAQAVNDRVAIAKAEVAIAKAEVAIAKAEVAIAKAEVAIAEANGRTADQERELLSVMIHQLQGTYVPTGGMKRARGRSPSPNGGAAAASSLPKKRRLCEAQHLVDPHHTDDSASERAKKANTGSTAFLNHFPIEQCGMPIKLYRCTAFETLTQSLEDGSQIVGQDLEVYHKLVKAVSSNVVDESTLRNDIAQALGAVEHVETVAVEESTPRPPRSEKVDIVLKGQHDCILGLVEVKTSFNQAKSDPFNQVCAYYQSHTSKNRGRKLHPKLLFVAIGPILQVWGAVRDIDGYICADYLACTSFVDEDGSTPNLQALRVVRAIRLGLGELQEFYSNSPEEQQRAQPMFHMGNRLRYEGHLQNWFEEVRNDVAPRRVKKFRLFKAKLDAGTNGERDVVVKFVPHNYPVDAHQAMYELEFAPELIHHENLQVDSWHVVVMEYIEATGGSLDQSNTFKDRLERALAQFHEQGWVHGDLRAPNVVIQRVTNRPFVVDFDWAGQAGMAKYPRDINMRLRWPNGVDADEVITAAHDNTLLQQLVTDAMEG